MFRNTVKANLKQGMRYTFLLSILAVTVSLSFDSLGTLVLTVNNPLIYQEGSTICVQYFYFNGVSFGGVFSTYFTAALAALPYAASYSVEQKSKMLIYNIARCGRRNYYISKMLTTAFFGGLSVFLGRLLFIVVLSTYLPLTTPARVLAMTGLPYHDALASGNGIGYFMIVLYLAFLSGALCSSVGMCVSAFIPNPYVAVCSPVIFIFLLVELGRLLKLPQNIRIELLLNASATIRSDAITLIFTSIAVIGAIVACYRLFSKRCERRLCENA